VGTVPLYGLRATKFWSPPGEPEAGGEPLVTGMMVGMFNGLLQAARCCALASALLMKDPEGFRLPYTSASVTSSFRE
jgi:hypothetical protein